VKEGNKRKLAKAKTEREERRRVGEVPGFSFIHLYLFVRFRSKHSSFFYSSIRSGSIRSEATRPRGRGAKLLDQEGEERSYSTKRERSEDEDRVLE